MHSLDMLLEESQRLLGVAGSHALAHDSVLDNVYRHEHEVSPVAFNVRPATLYSASESSNETVSSSSSSSICRDCYNLEKTQSARAPADPLSPPAREDVDRIFDGVEPGNANSVPQPTATSCLPHSSATLSATRHSEAAASIDDLDAMEMRGLADNTIGRATQLSVRGTDIMASATNSSPVRGPLWPTLLSRSPVQRNTANNRDTTALSGSVLSEAGHGVGAPHIYFV